MRHIYKYLLFLLLPFLANCSDNENWTIVTDVQPGTYITGSATMYSGEAPASALKVFPLDGNADGLSELVGIYTCSLMAFHHFHRKRSQSSCQ